MPYKTKQPCAYPNCSALVVRGMCAVHSAFATPARKPDTRASSAARGYDHKWRRIRAQYLKFNPVCKQPGCCELATDVDHILALIRGGTNEWANLQGLCHKHHSAKTAQYDGAFGNAIK